MFPFSRFPVFPFPHFPVLPFSRLSVFQASAWGSDRSITPENYYSNGFLHARHARMQYTCGFAGVEPPRYKKARVLGRRGRTQSQDGTPGILDLPGPPGECSAAPRQGRSDQCSFEIGFKNPWAFHDTAQPGWRTGPTRAQALRGGVAGSAAGPQPGEVIEVVPQESITSMASSMQDMRACSIHVASQG